MVEVFGPEGILCAGTSYEFEALNADSCLTIEWIVSGLPAGVSEDDIIYSAPNSLVTSIIVPVEGPYSFSVRCCEEA